MARLLLPLLGLGLLAIAALADPGLHPPRAPLAPKKPFGKPGFNGVQPPKNALPRKPVGAPVPAPRKVLPGVQKPAFGGKPRLPRSPGKHASKPNGPVFLGKPGKPVGAPVPAPRKVLPGVQKPAFRGKPRLPRSPGKPTTPYQLH